MAAVTPKGTIVMPSFNHGVPFDGGGSGYFDPCRTPTSNGAIPDHFWRMPRVYRSLNPTHRFAAWGKDADRYTRFHHRTLPMGADSPLGMLWRDGGCCLFIGVGYEANTFHHVVETVTAAPCLGRRSESYPVVPLPDDRRMHARTWSYRVQPCPIDDAVRYGKEMQRRGLHQQRMIGRSRLTLFKLQDCLELVFELLRDGYGAPSPCSRCPVRTRTNEHTVPSD